MKRQAQKIGFKKLTLSNLNNEKLEALRGGSSYHTYNCSVGCSNGCTVNCSETCWCPPADNSFRICVLEP
jgi:hypothetical protein